MNETKGLKVLIVDDSPQSLTAAIEDIKILTEVEPDIAYNYEEALEMLELRSVPRKIIPKDKQNDYYAFVLIDQDLGESENIIKKYGLEKHKEGLSLINEASEMARLASIVVLTAFRYTQKDEGPDALKYGAVDYIGKDEHPKKIRDAVSTLLKQFSYRVKIYNKKYQND